MESSLKDIARHARVSVATVSRVLRGQPGCSEATRLKVLQAMQEVGYQGSGHVAPQAFHTLGVLFPQVSSILVGEVLSGVEEAAHQAGFSVLVGKTDGSFARTLHYLQLLVSKGVNGIVFASDVLQREHFEVVRQAGIPLVLLSSVSYQFPVPCIRCDDRQAAFAATEHLIRQGHTNIGLLAGRQADLVLGTARVEGYRAAHLAHGLTVLEDNVVYTEGFAFRHGVQGFELLRQRNTGATAVFACSDEMAAGVLTAAHHHRIRIPQDLSVMGYDNLQLAQMCVPPLTTVEQPFHQMGVGAVQLLLEVLQGQPRIGSIVLPHQVIERETVGPRP